MAIRLRRMRLAEVYIQMIFYTVEGPQERINAMIGTLPGGIIAISPVAAAGAG